MAEAVCWARDLVNEPGGSLTPNKLAQQAVGRGTPAGFDVTVWDEKQIRKEKLGGLLGVNRGSDQRPGSCTSSTSRPSPRGTVATGRQGHHLRLRRPVPEAADGMIGMKGDMGGAAAVLGAVQGRRGAGARRSASWASSRSPTTYRRRRHPVGDEDSRSGILAWLAAVRLRESGG